MYLLFILGYLLELDSSSTCRYSPGWSATRATISSRTRPLPALIAIRSSVTSGATKLPVCAASQMSFWPRFGMVLPARDRNSTYQGMTAQDVFDCVYVIFAHDLISSRQNYILKKKFDEHDWEIQVIVVALVHKTIPSPVAA